jgi:hypothetical protein
MLAVRMRGLATSTYKEEEEDQEVDEFLSFLGFEFVDVCLDGKSKSTDDDDVLSEGMFNGLFSLSFITLYITQYSSCTPAQTPRHTKSPSRHRCSKYNNVAIDGSISVRASPQK